MKKIKEIEFKQPISANGMQYDRINKVWESNKSGTIQKLVEGLGEDLTKLDEDIVWKVNGFLDIAVYEVAQDMLYKYGMIWGKTWRDIGFGTLIKKNKEWIIEFDENDRDWLISEVIDKYK